MTRRRDVEEDHGQRHHEELEHGVIVDHAEPFELAPLIDGCVRLVFLVKREAGIAIGSQAAGP